MPPSAGNPSHRRSPRASAHEARSFAERLERRAVAPVEGEEAAGLAGGGAGDPHALDHRHLGAAVGQEVCGCAADRPSADDENFHGNLGIRRPSRSPVLTMIRRSSSPQARLAAPPESQRPKHRTSYRSQSSSPLDTPVAKADAKLLIRSAASPRAGLQTISIPSHLKSPSFSSSASRVPARSAAPIQLSVRSPISTDFM
jgi:hypothetical protein